MDNHTPNNSPQLCDNCTGCGSCTAVCARNAIHISTDQNGFYMPFVDPEKCVNCGLCTKFCLLPQNKNGVLKAYGLRHKDPSVLKTSMSGGFFYTISEYVLNVKKGVVYGSAIKDNFEVGHIRVAEIENLHKLQGSKYTQSLIDKTTYQQALDDIVKGTWVVFSGTACQIDKFKTLLDMKRIDQSKVILVDIVCHGVPSSSLWNDYKAYLNKSLKGLEIIDFKFRDKIFGWSKFWESYTVRIPWLGKKYGVTFKLYSVLHAKLYGSSLFTRESCFHCKYANVNRASDFTMGDYWRWKESIPGFCNDDDRGISLVLLHSEKSLALFEQIKDKLTYIDCTDLDYLQMNLRKPTEKPKNYEQAQQDYRTLGFDKFTEKYGFNTKSRRIKRLLRNVLLKIQGL